MAGRPLVSYPLEVLASVCDRVAVVCKRETQLPLHPGAERWNEPDEPRHPLAGIVHALERADAPVLVCAGDMPFVTVAACHELLEAVTRREGDARAATVAEAEGSLEPLLGLYTPDALPALRAAAPAAPLRAAVAALDPLRVAVGASVVRSVNTPDDLEAATRALAGGGP